MDWDKIDELIKKPNYSLDKMSFAINFCTEIPKVLESNNFEVSESACTRISLIWICQFRNLCLDS